jgi:multiple sugar transport system substrate-binding protein
MPVRRQSLSALVVSLSLLVAACGSGSSSPSAAGPSVAPLPSATGAGPTVGASEAVPSLEASSSTETSASSTAASPVESAGAGESTQPSPGESIALATPLESIAPPASVAPADITGALQVLGNYGCTPIPCRPPEGTGADEIARTRYDVFASMYPNVQLSFTESDFDAQQFLTQVSSGNVPDVVRMDRQIMGTYIANGALEPIDDCIPNRQINMPMYRAAAINSVTFNGHVYGIPEFYDTRIVMINDSVLKDAGVSKSQIDTSDWDALAQVNQKLLKTDNGKVSRIGFDPKLPEFLPLWAAANGAKLISDDGKTAMLNDPKVGEALDYAVSLIKAHGSPADFLDFRANGPGGKDFFGETNQFASDTLGAFPMEEWYLNVLASVSPKEGVSFAPFKDRQGNPITFASGSAWVIPTAAKNKDAACEFMRVITLPDTWFAAAKARADIRAKDGEPFTGTYTANTLADQRIFSELVNKDTAGSYYDGVQLVLQNQDKAINLPVTPAAEEFNRIWQDAVNRVLNEGVTSTDALAQAQTDAQAAIDKAGQGQ